MAENRPIDTFSSLEEAAPDFGERYEVIEVLGQGGMGTVLKARHRRLSKLVAIKVLNAAIITDPTSKQRFEIEAQAGSKLQHPNLISVFDYGWIKAGTPYLVMEFVDGESLAEVLEKQGGRLELNQFVDIFKQVCKGLQYIHSNCIVHRDLKTSNIMVHTIEGERYVKLLDFGIAKVLGEGEGLPAQQLTKTGSVFGSPPYMSPEQCMGKPTDARSDIFSLGCVMYECLAGTPPLLGDNALQTLFKHANEDAEPLRLDIDNQLARDLKAIIHKCLERAESARFQQTSELLSALNGLTRESTGAQSLSDSEKHEIANLWKKMERSGDVETGNLAAQRQTADFTNQSLTGQRETASHQLNETRKLRTDMQTVSSHRDWMRIAGVTAGCAILLLCLFKFGEFVMPMLMTHTQTAKTNATTDSSIADKSKEETKPVAQTPAPPAVPTTHTIPTNGTAPTSMPGAPAMPMQGAQIPGGQTVPGVPANVTNPTNGVTYPGATTNTGANSQDPELLRAQAALMNAEAARIKATTESSQTFMNAHLYLKNEQQKAASYFGGPNNIAQPAQPVYPSNSYSRPARSGQQTQQTYKGFPGVTDATRNLHDWVSE